ncbi:MAG: glycosyltransferase family 4 protein [Lachnospiraceae bacterium]|nr:glycosyltransferase family 4 protein [Lachnospiraceae bacterium]
MVKVVMIGPARNVHGGVSTMVNNYYAAGLDKCVNLTYISTMVDGSKFRKLLQAVWAYLVFLTFIPGMDILHANMSPNASYYRKKFFIDTAAFFNKKIIIHFHGGDFQTFYQQSTQKSQETIRRTLNKAHIFLVLSPEWKAVFDPLISPGKIIILGNAVPLPEMKKNDYSSHDLLFLGRMCRDKGIGELLEVMPRLKERFPDVKLYLGGIWTDDELKKKADSMKDMVKCLGWIDKETQQKYAGICSIFVLPTYFEGQPNSVIEAMAYGMVPVATAVGGIPQMILDKVNGRLINPRDTDALYEALAELLDNEDLRRNYGEAARKHIKEKFDIVDLVEKLGQIYDSAMAKESAG